VSKVIPMRGKGAERREARAHLVYEFLPALVPTADVNERRRLADEMLACIGFVRRVRMTPELLVELFSVHGQCVFDQQGKCVLTVFVKPLAWEINKAMGVANEVDAAFRRLPGMCAAKPVSESHFGREGAEIVASMFEEEPNGDV
jgi:hypothetical protein